MLWEWLKCHRSESWFLTGFHKLSFYRKHEWIAQLHFFFIILCLDYSKETKHAVWKDEPLKKQTNKPEKENKPTKQ